MRIRQIDILCLCASRQPKDQFVRALAVLLQFAPDGSGKVRAAGLRWGNKIELSVRDMQRQGI